MRRLPPHLPGRHTQQDLLRHWRARCSAGVIEGEGAGGRESDRARGSVNGSCQQLGMLGAAAHRGARRARVRKRRMKHQGLSWPLNVWEGNCRTALMGRLARWSRPRCICYDACYESPCGSAYLLQFLQNSCSSSRLVPPTSVLLIHATQYEPLGVHQNLRPPAAHRVCSAKCN